MKNKVEKPTREERLKSYEFARDWLNDKMDNQVGVCQLLRIQTEADKIEIKDFPEFLEMKPIGKDANGYWFNDAKERIQVLTKIINKMKNKMKNEKRIPIEIPNDCEARFDEENKVLIISKKKEEIYIPSVEDLPEYEFEANCNVSSLSRAEAFDSLAQLVEMRDAANGDWKADWRDDNQDKWVIYFDEEDDVDIFNRNSCREILVFKTLAIAKAFLKKHREMIITAKELL